VFDILSYIQMEGNHKLPSWGILSLTYIQLLCTPLMDCLAFPKDNSKLLYVIQLYILLGRHKERPGMDLCIPY
jgi:hypothetical protein